MPEIPRYQSQTPTKPYQAPQESPEQVSGAFQAQQEGTAVLSNMAAQLDERRQRIEYQREVSDAYNQINDYSNQLRDFEMKEKSMTLGDTVGNIERTERFKKDYMEKHRDKIPRSVKMKYEQDITKITESLKDQLAQHQAQEVRKLYLQITKDSMDNAIKDSRLTPAKADEYSQRSREQLDIFVNNGMLGSEEAEVLKTASDAAVYGAALDGWIAYDPAAGRALIESGVYNKYLTTDQLDDYKKKADTAERAKRVEDEQERLRLKREQDAEREAIGQALAKKWFADELSKEDIQEVMTKLHPTDGPNSALSWLARWEESQKPGKEISNPEAYANWSRRVFTNPTDIDAYMIYDAPGLSTKDREHLTTVLNANKKRNDPLKVERAKTAFEMVDKLYKEGVFGRGKKGLQEWARQVRDLSIYMGTYPEEDPIEGYVNKVLEPVGSTWILDKYDPEKQRISIMGGESTPGIEREPLPPDFPPASENQGIIIRQKSTGIYRKSDGLSWTIIPADQARKELGQ